jgi:hypothetical protein
VPYVLTLRSLWMAPPRKRCGRGMLPHPLTPTHHHHHPVSQPDPPELCRGGWKKKKSCCCQDHDQAGLPNPPPPWKVLRYRAPRASRRRSPSTRHSWVKTAAQPSLCAGGLLLHLVVARLPKPKAKAILGHLKTMCPFPIMRFCALVSILSVKYNAKMALRWMMHLPRSGTIQLTFLGFVVEYNMYILFAHAFCLVNSLKSALGQNIFMMK